MKKIFYASFATVLCLSISDLSAAIQYNLQTGTGEAYFTVDDKSTVYVDVKQLADGKSIALGDSVISNIGYYYYDDVSSYRGKGGGHGRFPGPGQMNQSAAQPTLHYGDMKTGALGEFNPGDKIVLWVETTSANGQKSAFTMYSPTTQTSDIWMLSKSGDNIVFNWGDFGVDYGKKAQHALNPEGYLFSITTAHSGQPLPGIIATVLVGGGTLIYLKKRKKLYGAEK